MEVGMGIAYSRGGKEVIVIGVAVALTEGDVYYVPLTDQLEYGKTLTSYLSLLVLRKKLVNNCKILHVRFSIFEPK